jgi:hypothetical protein
VWVLVGGPFVKDIDVDDSGPRLVKSRDHFEQGCFAAAIAAHGEKTRKGHASRRRACPGRQMT